MNKNIIIISAAAVFAVALSAGLYIKISSEKMPSTTATKAPARALVKMGEETAMINRADKDITQGDEAAAVKELEALINKYPATASAERAHFAMAGLYEKRQDLIKAKDEYKKIIDKFPASESVQKAQAALEQINIKILFSPTLTPDSVLYEVQKGDTLTKIAKKFNTTNELIEKANGLKGGVVKLGKKLKVENVKFSIVVDKSQYILTLKTDKELIKTYRISTGKNQSTPVGTFKITTKIVNPPWYPAAGGVIPYGDPRNVLGSRWMGISKQSYGIHGTTEPEAIGKDVTEGCVRLKNSDVEELYAIVPEGTEVVILD